MGIVTETIDATEVKKELETKSESETTKNEKES